MRDIERMKFATLLNPQSKTNGNFDSNTYVDTKGWGHLRVLFITGALEAAIGSTAEGTAPYLEECDTSGGTYSTVSDAALADAISDSEDNSRFAIDYDLRKSHKRYVRVNVPHAGSGACLLVILAILSEPESGPPHDGLADAAGLTELISA